MLHNVGNMNFDVIVIIVNEHARKGKGQTVTIKVNNIQEVCGFETFGLHRRLPECSHGR